MNRRKFISAGGAGVTTLLAGCVSGVLESSSPPEMEWQTSWKGYLDGSGNVVLVVTGEAENVGGQKAEEIKLTCQVQGTDGSTIAEKWRKLRDIEPAEEQLFYFTFQLTTAEARRVDDVQVDGEFPNAE